MNDTGVVILAAGSSSRLGAPKQLLDFQGKPLLRHVIDQTLPLSFGASILVLGAHAADIRKAVDPGPFQVLINDHWGEGIASGIRAGVEALLKASPVPERILFLLCDQPLVDTRCIAGLLDLHRTSGLPLGACVYSGTVGVPAVFSRAFFPELLSLQGDIGAGRIIRQNGSQTALYPFEPAAVDVDHMEDYRLLTGGGGIFGASL